MARRGRAGAVRRGLAGLGSAGFGKAGLARPGAARQGLAGQGRAGRAWPGAARLGMARRGMAGQARHGRSRRGGARLGEAGGAGLGMAGQVWRGVARLGLAWLGRARQGRHGVEVALTTSTSHQRGCNPNQKGQEIALQNKSENQAPTKLSIAFPDEVGPQTDFLEVTHLHVEEGDGLHPAIVINSLVAALAIAIHDGCAEGNRSIAAEAVKGMLDDLFGTNEENQNR